MHSLDIHSLVPDWATKPGNVESSKTFIGILYHKNVFPQKIKTQTFYNMKISRSTVNHEWMNLWFRLMDREEGLTFTYLL